MKILLFGATGQLGRALVTTLTPIGEVIALDSTGADFTQPYQLAAQVLAHQPDIIVNAAAYTAVDQAEAEPAVAMAVNATAVETLAKAAIEVNALLLHYSTDYVFDGTQTHPYKETDSPAPLNLYGKSKLAGERAIVGSGCDYLILRTSWVYSACGTNFVLRILTLAEECIQGQRAELRVVDDQLGSPTFAPALATASAQLLQLAHRERQGKTFFSQLYHLCGQGHTSWYEFARHIVVEAQSCGLLASTPRLVPVTSDDYAQAAQRPRRAVLDTRKSQECGLCLPDWRNSLRDLVRGLAASRRL